MRPEDKPTYQLYTEEIYITKVIPKENVNNNNNWYNTVGKRIYLTLAIVFLWKNTKSDSSLLYTKHSRKSHVNC